MSPSFRRTLLLLLLASGPGSRAAQLGSPDSLLSVEVHGFVSQGFLYSTHQNNYLARSSRGSFEFTEVGVNFTKTLVDRLRIGVQLFTRDLGPLGNYSIRADWFYLDYRWQDWLGIRVGRVKLPFGLYNEVNDIDAARVPVLLPQSLYPIESRDFLLAQTGGELYGYVRLGGGGALDYRAYGGTIYVQPTIPATATYKLDDLGVPYVVGGRLMWETPLDGLRVGASVQALRIDSRLLLDPPLSLLLTASLPAALWVASAEYSAHELLIAAEYSRWHTWFVSNQPALFPDNSGSSERAYAMVSYRVKSWFTPSLYYAVLFPDVTQRTASRATQRHDVAATLRFDINPYWLVKLEAHYLNGTAGLSAALNNGRTPTQLAREWGLFLIKTTGYF